MKKLRFNSTWPVIIIFFSIGILLRVWKFGMIPNGLNRDEASLGYTAYAILKNGIDEYGRRFPFIIESFGDQKLPVYIYTTIPFVALFGLEDWVVRLPSLLAGIEILLVIPLVAAQIFKEKKYTWIPVFTLGGVAVSPWAIHFSRIAYEANLALAFFLTGLLFFLLAIQRLTVNEKKSADRYLLAGFFLFSLTVWTYHSYQIFIPFFLFGMLFIFRHFFYWPRGDEIKQNKFRPYTMALSFFILVFFFSMIFFKGGILSGTTKFSGITPFKHDVLWRTIQDFRISTGHDSSFLAKLLFNPFTEVLRIFFQNVLLALSPTFFFSLGGAHGVHNIPGLGNLPLYASFFFFIGIVTLFIMNLEARKFLLPWILASLVAPSLTIEPMHTVRISPIFPVIEIIVAYGIWKFLVFFGSFQDGINRGIVKKLIAGIFLSLLYLFYLGRFSTIYFGRYPIKQASVWRSEMKELSINIFENREKYQKLVIGSPNTSPYIWLLFYSSYDPSKLKESLKHYPTDEEGYHHVLQLENIRFETADVGTDRERFQAVRYYLRPTEVLKDFREQSEYKRVGLISHPLTHEISYEIWDYHR